MELRLEEVQRTSIEVQDGELSGVATRPHVGLAARVLVRGAWGFASGPGTDRIAGRVERACRIARAISTHLRRPVRLAEVPAVQASLRKRPRRDPLEVPLEEKAQLLATLHRELRGLEPRTKSSTVMYEDLSGRKWLLTSDGTSFRTELLAVYQYTTAQGRGGPRIGAVKDEFGAVEHGWEHLERRERPAEVAERLARKLACQLDGKRPRGGSPPCVLAPILTGLFGHESLGHLCEADLAEHGAFAGSLGKQVGPEELTLIDTGHAPEGFGNLAYDDEGVRTRPIRLIDKGWLSGLMTNREYAAALDLPPTGSARAESYQVRPIIRMRNTFFERGSAALEELLSGIREGYYCVDFKGGQMEMNSAFHVGVQEGYEIRRGKIGGPVAGLAISGLATEALQRVSLVGRDFGMESGVCGKDQEAYTSDGGPHLRVERGGIVVGARQ